MAEPHTGIIVVCGSDARMVGVLTKTDIVRQITRCARNRCTARVETIMTRDVASCQIEAGQMSFKGGDRMSEQGSDPFNAELLRQRMLSRWDNEGGAGPDGPQTEAAMAESQIPMPSNDAAEVGAMHIRIIALENLVISLLATASDQQVKQAGEMARYIFPRPGATHHPLTTHAAAHMVDLVERASRFRNRPPL